jgi:hypothetical protein
LGYLPRIAYAEIRYPEKRVAFAGAALYNKRQQRAVT